MLSPQSQKEEVIHLTLVRMGKVTEILLYCRGVLGMKLILMAQKVTYYCAWQLSGQIFLLLE